LTNHKYYKQVLLCCWNYIFTRFYFFEPNQVNTNVIQNFISRSRVIWIVSRLIVPKKKK